MNCLVFDNGTSLSKIGFNEDNYPRFVIPSHVQSLADAKKLSFIRRGGFQVNFDYMEQFWGESFELLKVSPREVSVFLSEPPLLPSKNKIRKAEIMFENFNVESLFLSPEGILPLYACGEVTGLVLECGAGHTYTTAVFDSHILPTSLSRYELAGIDLTNHLAQILELGKGCTFKSSFNNKQQEIKEKSCYCALNYLSELDIAASCSILDESYILPDGSTVVLNLERFQIPEILFNPTIMHSSIPSIHTIISQAICNCAIDTRRDLYKCVVLSGGSTMIPGMKERLELELNKIAPSNIEINIIASPERNIGVWIGGAVLSSLSSFQQAWISKRTYMEFGSRIFSSDLQY